MHSTALDNGVALLHPRRPMPAILAEAVLALGITPGGIPFGSGGSLTDIFFPDLLHERPRTSADPGPAEPRDQRSRFPGRGPRRR